MVFMPRPRVLDSEQEIEVLLYHMADFSPEDIASAFGVSRSTIRRVIAGTYRVSRGGEGRRSTVPVGAVVDDGAAPAAVALDNAGVDKQMEQVKYILPTRLETSTFWNGVKVADADKCWELKGNKLDVMWVGGTTRPARSVAYELHNRVFLPYRARVTFHCGNEKCCNPNHLEYRSSRQCVSFDEVKLANQRGVEVIVPVEEDELPPLISTPVKGRYVYLDFKDGWVGVHIEPKDQATADALKAAVSTADRKFLDTKRKWIFKEEVFHRVVPVLVEHCPFHRNILEPKHQEYLTELLTGPVGVDIGTLADLLDLDIEQGN